MSIKESHMAEDGVHSETVLYQELKVLLLALSYDPEQSSEI